MNPTGSFLRFLLGFFTFIGLSFLVTFSVNTYTVTQNSEKQTAAAIQAMLEQK
jgi:hypothetical protein